MIEVFCHVLICIENENKAFYWVISGFGRNGDEICDLLGYYGAQNGKSLPTFRDNLSATSSRVKKFLIHNCFPTERVSMLHCYIAWLIFYSGWYTQQSVCFRRLMNYWPGYSLFSSQLLNFILRYWQYLGLFWTWRFVANINLFL